MKSTNLLIIATALLLSYPFAASAQSSFTAREQQVVSLPTSGLFRKGSSFDIDFSRLAAADYSFPLPVGKAQLLEGKNELKITTTKGDAVKAMFDGVVRLSRKMPKGGNTVVLRHANGLETVYASNAQNLVKVGQKVNAGQTVAIVGGRGEESYCLFAIMVNGNRINPSTLLELSSHKLRSQVVSFRKNGNRVTVSVNSDEDNKEGIKKVGESQFVRSLDPDDEIAMEKTAIFKLDLQKIEKQHWAYPLPGSHVISPYGGRRKHSGVDIKTKPNDRIVAAFDGVVTQSGPYFGYGNYIVIRHAYGFSTCYSHQSKNFVKVGQKVRAGEVIGLTGRTGRATTEHLHFEVRFHNRTINPAVFFNHANHSLQARVLTVDKSGRVK